MDPTAEKQPPQPREMTPEEEAAEGPEMDLRRLSSVNRSQFDPAQLAPYMGRWVAWSPDSSRIVTSAEDIDTLDELVLKEGEDPSQCAIEYIDGE